MSQELYWLTLTLIATACFWLPYILNRIYEHGLIPALHNPHRDQPAKAGWANRMQYAHQNAVENLVLFAPLVLILHTQNISNQLTQSATCIYFFTRLVHFVSYSLGIPYIRTVAFFIGFLAQMAMAFTILNSVVL